MDAPLRVLLRAITSYWPRLPDQTQRTNRAHYNITDCVAHANITKSPGKRNCEWRIERRIELTMVVLRWYCRKHCKRYGGHHYRVVCGCVPLYVTQPVLLSVWQVRRARELKNCAGALELTRTESWSHMRPDRVAVASWRAKVGEVQFCSCDFDRARIVEQPQRWFASWFGGSSCIPAGFQLKLWSTAGCIMLGIRLSEMALSPIGAQLPRQALPRSLDRA